MQTKFYLTLPARHTPFLVLSAQSQTDANATSRIKLDRDKRVENSPSISIFASFCVQVPSESSVGTNSTTSSEVSRPVSLTSLGSCSSSGSSGPHQPSSAYLASAESLDSDPEPTGSQGQLKFFRTYETGRHF